MASTTPGDRAVDVSNGNSVSAVTSGHHAGPSASPAPTGISLPSGASPDPNGTQPYTDQRLFPRDGRVRNPVPSKLKGVTEDQRGNFGVMHMDVSSYRESQGRDAAAKRTSEGTALQAKLARTDTYVSHHRRGNYPRPTGLKQFHSGSSIQSSEQVNPPPVEAQSDNPVLPGPLAPLAIGEIKSEQARLLTLLRSLPPATVVDQICKALAFFGGVPEAPPPTDGKFPDSNEGNGSGSLFVGWIAEIFPDPQRPRRLIAPNPALPLAPKQKRPRGRPKGSKASKVRSDKGIKKGSQKKNIDPMTTIQNAEPSDGHDEGWVDVEDSVLELNESGDLVESFQSRENPSTPPGHQNGEPSLAPPADSSVGPLQTMNIVDDSLQPNASSTGKRRGRPKGSKNRPKDTAAAPPPGQSNGSTNAPVDGAIGDSVTSSITTPVPGQSSTPADPKQRKTSGGRAKTSKNRMKTGSDETQAQTEPMSQPQSIATATSGIVTQTPNHAHSPLFTERSSNKGPTSSTTQRVGHTTQGPSPVNNIANPTPQVKESSITGAKRKRQSAASSGADSSNGVANNAGNGGGAYSEHISHPSSVSITASPHLNKSVGHSGSTPAYSSSSGPPNAKRSRKSNATVGAATASRRQSGSGTTLHNMTPSAATRPESGAREELPVTAAQHAPAEGLEAHFQRMVPSVSFASRPQKQQSSQSATSMAGRPVAQPQVEGLEAHFERFTALQRQEGTRQASNSRPQAQKGVPTSLPPVSKASQASQVAGMATSQQQQKHNQNQSAQPQPQPPSHQQPRGSQKSYYSQPQPHGPSYKRQSQPYVGNQRQKQQQQQQQQQQQKAQRISNSPGSGLIHHVGNSPQFGAQSNSPLLQADSNYRGSPTSVMQNTGPFTAPRRTTSASSLEGNNSTGGSGGNYRTGNTSRSAVAQHPSQFAAQHTPTTHTAPHSAMPSATFTAFSDQPLFDLQGLDAGSNHGGLNLGNNTPYGLAGGNQQHQQQNQHRTTGPTTSAYPSPTGMNSYMGSAHVGRTSQQQHRWP